MKRTHLTLLVVLLLPMLAAPAAAASVNGTVTVVNGTADGDRVTVTPMDRNFERAGDPANVTVSGETFTADGLTDASLYFIRVTHGGSAHYALVRNGTTPNIELGERVSGRVVTPNGTPRSDVRVTLQSELGPTVDTTTTDAEGNFSFAPVKTNATYTVEVRVNGAPYSESVQTGTNATGVTIEAGQATSNTSVLTATATSDRPAGHLLQVMAPRNDSESTTVVETFSLRNTADRPFVGQVTIEVPESASPMAGMYRGQRVRYTQDGQTVSVNASLAAGETARVGVAYTLDGQTMSKPVQYSPDQVAVVLQGYAPETVNHSDNLRVGDSPIPMLTNAGEVQNGDTLRLEFPANATAPTSGSQASQSSAASPGAGSGGDSNSIPHFPILQLMLLTVGMAVGGIVAYRVF